jgi:DNA-binding response OmpR family regulator
LERTTSSAGTDGSPTPKECILVVDDEAEVRSVLARVLGKAGYAVLEAPDGSTALDILARDRQARQRGETAEYGPIRLVTTDVQMPNMSGDDLHRMIRERYPEVRVMMVTAFADVETAVECMRLGAADYVLKPFSVSDIIVRVRRALESHPPR